MKNVTLGLVSLFVFGPLNSITAQNSENVNLLEACNTAIKFDIICILE